MKYKEIVAAEFISRPNRFIAEVLIKGKRETVHVKNTGRCREILIPGTTVLLEKASGTVRKTNYSIVSAYKGSLLINIDSQVPNTVVYEALKQGLLEEIPQISLLKREVTFGSSRFDMYFETPKSKGFIEVKGVTLEEDGTAMFPDAPTQRGTRHVHELIRVKNAGYDAFVFFLIQMKHVHTFMPNCKTDPSFAKAVRLAADNGVRILAYDSLVTEQGIDLGGKVSIQL